MSEHFAGYLEEMSVCYVGDGRNNVARSLLVTGALLGFDVRIATPESLRPPAEVIALAHDLAAENGANVLVTDDPDAGVHGANFLYTDVWLSMGEPEQEWESRINLLRPYRVTADLMARTGRPDTLFMHCLPSLHNTETTLGARLHERFGLDGIEVDEQVFESPHSIVFAQAENRMHTIKAVMVSALGWP
jgi:ornithine carbamoyltransferase